MTPPRPPLRKGGELCAARSDPPTASPFEGGVGGGSVSLAVVQLMGNPLRGTV